jgi:hypothetical protein
MADFVRSGRQAIVRMIRRTLLPEHPLQRQIADALRFELAPPGKVSRDGVVWWSVDHASYAGTAPGARVGRVLSQVCRTCSCCSAASPTWSKSRYPLANYRTRSSQ